MSKRARVGSQNPRAARPCAIVPIEGHLQADSEVLDSMAKLVTMAPCNSDLAGFASCVKDMQERSGDGMVSFGSMCTGSGLGDLSLIALAMSLGRATSHISADVFDCKFVCELDRKKAMWLSALEMAPLVFKDIVLMGMDQTFDWRSNGLQAIPPVQVLFLGFSCKDLSQMNEKMSSATEYVIDTLHEFMEAPDDVKFDPNLQEEPLKGTTAPTLIGALQYIRKHLPEYVLMENVVGVKKITLDLEELFKKLGYAFFATDTMDPTEYGLPIHRPRVYFGARRCNSLRANPQTYGSDVLAVVTRLSQAFREQTPMTLETFLLADPQDYHSKLPLSSADDGSAADKWCLKHEKAFEALGRGRPSGCELAKFAQGTPCAAMSKWFLAQPLRSQEIAFYGSLCVPTAGSECQVDLSQTIERAHIAGSSTPDLGLHTFTARTVSWLVRSRRLLSGLERLAMHGLSPSVVHRVQRTSREDFTDAFLGDLAGNSFAATCFMCALIAGAQR